MNRVQAIAEMLFALVFFTFAAGLLCAITSACSRPKPLGPEHAEPLRIRPVLLDIDNGVDTGWAVINGECLYFINSKVAPFNDDQPCPLDIPDAGFPPAPQRQP